MIEETVSEKELPNYIGLTRSSIHARMLLELTLFVLLEIWGKT